MHCKNLSLGSSMGSKDKYYCQQRAFFFPFMANKWLVIFLIMLAKISQRQGDGFGDLRETCLVDSQDMLKESLSLISQEGDHRHLVCFTSQKKHIQTSVSTIPWVHSMHQIAEMIMALRFIISCGNFSKHIILHSLKQKVANIRKIHCYETHLHHVSKPLKISVAEFQKSFDASCCQMILRYFTLRQS